MTTHTKPRKTERILFVGGGSGGHIYPLIAIENKLSKDLNIQSVYIAANKSIDSFILSTNDKRFILLSQLTWNITSLTNVLFLIQSIYILLCLLLRFKPSLIISTASRTSILPVLLAKFFGHKIILIELNSTFGKVSRVLAPICNSTLICWPKTSGFTGIFNKTIRIDPPLRKIPLPTKHSEAPTITIVGGSQGARFLNRKIPALIKSIANSTRIQVFHFTGFQDLNMVKNSYGELPNIHVISYSDSLPEYLAKSDIIISRSGANIIFEGAFLKKTLFLVPISYSSFGHQFQNADTLAKNGCSILLNERSLESRHSQHLLIEYIKDKDRRELMGKQIWNFFFTGNQDLITIIRKFL
ncbi:MAG: UDP-N-acetylglucosamine--N-acetylmuramyl-(pentapeptide) pyrophosphoryl-undecaprenol N-acetylglucosamine transferase [Planctomycetes bacterium]|nr:UDP-N-acetylglucosamine--N-acetylmuramyl-(pentapeptide) pyrophosphoryl-undecaprenol N-acetylglucosamine transferase [Planctomycetota bacterium]